MLKQKTYNCGICNSKPDQISHHKSHLDTQKHKDKKELFELRLSKLNSIELEEKYSNTNITEIVDNTETIIFDNDRKLNETEDDIDTTLMNNIIMSESNSISNKDALRDKIHELHNFLRNNGAGYGMNALKVFNILYGLKKLEENDLLDKVNLSSKCKFSYLLQISNENRDEELASLIFGDVLTSIGKSNIRDLLFYEIPQNIKGSVFAYLIKEIEKITLIEKTCNVLLSGKIYEYFIGRDESAISELGAYFTDRHIVDYIYTKLNPKMCENGTIPSMIDMFGGSGGFTTGYINILNTKYPELVKWETEINKIYHYDMNEDVIKSSGLEIFCLAGVLPNMNNLKYKNSFTDEFIDDSTNTNKHFHYVITNPPYGGDKKNKSEAQIKRDKTKEYIKKELLTITDEDIKKRRQLQLKKMEAKEKQEKRESDKTKVSVPMCSGRIQKFAKDHTLIGNDKESCSLMLMMDLLEVGGTSIGVLKEGVFFDSKYKNVRKILIQNFNVREVISVPSDQFENTKTGTSIVIFDNTEAKTTEVIFRDLSVDKRKENRFEEINGDIYLVENKGDIMGISDTLVSVASVDELLKNSIYSLNGKDYNKKEIVVGEGYELKKLGNVCEFHKYKDMKLDNSGLHNYYTCSNTIQKCSNGNITGEYNLIGTRGTISNALHYYNGTFGCGNNMLLFNSNINNKFIYYTLISLKEIINKSITGSTIPMISLTNFKEINIPVPKSPEKIQEWVDKISKPYNEKNEKQTRIKELEIDIQNRIKEITEKEECDEVELGSVCEYIKTGKNKTPDNKEGTLYPYYGTADITGYTDHYLFDGKHILVARNGTMGNCFLVEGKIYPSDHIFVIKNKEIYGLTFIYYLIKSISEKIQNSSNGSIIKGISKVNLSQINIKIPKNKQIITDMEYIFQEIETLQIEIKSAEELYKQFIQELSNEAIPKNNQEVITQNIEPVNEQIIVEEPKVKKIKIIKRIIKKPTL